MKPKHLERQRYSASNVRLSCFPCCATYRGQVEPGEIGDEDVSLAWRGTACEFVLLAACGGKKDKERERVQEEHRVKGVHRLDNVCVLLGLGHTILRQHSPPQLSVVPRNCTLFATACE